MYNCRFLVFVALKCLYGNSSPALNKWALSYNIIDPELDFNPILEKTKFKTPSPVNLDKILKVFEKKGQIEIGPFFVL